MADDGDKCSVSPDFKQTYASIDAKREIKSNNLVRIESTHPRNCESNWALTRSQPSGGRRAKNRLMRGDASETLSSGDVL